MIDEELLKFAAKAAGMDVVFEPEYLTWFDRGRGRSIWSPLTDDGDALRLAIDLNLIVETGKCWVSKHGPMFGEDATCSPYAATRRAIVLAAAELGRGMK